MLDAGLHTLNKESCKTYNVCLKKTRSESCGFFFLCSLTLRNLYVEVADVVIAAD